MNKILLSGLAGLAVVNAANADINLRRAMCEDIGNVWVEKTEECVPANTCESDDESVVENYCIQSGLTVPLAASPEATKLLIDKYAEKVLDTSVSHMRILNLDTIVKDLDAYVAIETEDGGYYVMYFRSGDSWYDGFSPAEMICWAFGKELDHISCEDVTVAECDEMESFLNQMYSVSTRYSEIVNADVTYFHNECVISWNSKI